MQRCRVAHEGGKSTNNRDVEGWTTAVLAAGTRGDAEGGRRGASSRESWGRLGPVTCGTGFSGEEHEHGV
jgi:hypothetical protein